VVGDTVGIEVVGVCVGLEVGDTVGAVVGLCVGSDVVGCPVTTTGSSRMTRVNANVYKIARRDRRSRRRLQDGALMTVTVNGDVVLTLRMSLW